MQNFQAKVEELAARAGLSPDEAREYKSQDMFNNPEKHRALTALHDALSADEHLSQRAAEKWLKALEEHLLGKRAA